MKIQAFLKIAVVATAALAAYAFSGSTESLDLYSIKVDGQCTNIQAGCTNPENGPSCTIIMDGLSTDVFDLSCSRVIKHHNSNPVQWELIP